MICNHKTQDTPIYNLVLDARMYVMHITLHWGRDQGAVILQAIFSNAVSDKTLRTLIDISLKCVFNCPVNTKSTLVQIMAWCQTEDRPLSEPMKSSLPVRCADVASCITMENAWRVDRLKHRQCSLIPCQGLWNSFLNAFTHQRDRVVIEADHRCPWF